MQAMVVLCPRHGFSLSIVYFLPQQVASEQGYAAGTYGRLLNFSSSPKFWPQDGPITPLTLHTPAGYQFGEYFTLLCRSFEDRMFRQLPFGLPVHADLTLVEGGLSWRESRGCGEVSIGALNHQRKWLKMNKLSNGPPLPPSVPTCSCILGLLKHPC